MLKVKVSSFVPGDYAAVITEALEDISKRGNPMLVVRLTLKSECKSMITSYLAWIDSAAWKLEEFMVSLGLPLSDGATAEISDPSILVGMSCLVRVDFDETAVGAPRLRIEKWLKPVTI